MACSVLAVSGGVVCVKLVAGEETVVLSVSYFIDDFLDHVGASVIGERKNDCKDDAEGYAGNCAVCIVVGGSGDMRDKAGNPVASKRIADGDIDKPEEAEQDIAEDFEAAVGGVAIAVLCGVTYADCSS